MPFVAKRAFGYDPIEISADWGLRDLRAGMAYCVCSTLECADCQALFLDYRFSDDEMSHHYADYRGAEYTAMRAQFEPSYLATAGHFQGRAAYLDEVERHLLHVVPTSPRILDWGGDCGINTPLRFRARAIDVYDISGVETCPEARRVSLNECLSKEYDLITCSQVLEHVPNPVGMLREIKHAMRSGTILYLEVPLEEIFRSETATGPRGRAKRHWHEHVNFFSPASLQALARVCGLRVLAHDTLNVSLGWREAAVQMLVCTLP
jgi:SAM-dependent methyltransferase